MFFINFYCPLIIILCIFAGCGPFTNKIESSIDSTISKLDLADMPTIVPEDMQKKLAWGLWKLDKNIIVESLNVGVKPYNLEEVVDVSEVIPTRKQLSPYALIIEGYLARTRFEEGIDNIFDALNQLYECIEILIKNNVSVDKGILTFGSHATMREFVHQSLARLDAARKSQEGLDAEGRFALNIWKRIQALIDSYQSK